MTVSNLSVANLPKSRIKLVRLSKNLFIPDPKNLAFSLSIKKSGADVWRVFLHVFDEEKRIRNRFEFDTVIRTTDFPLHLNIPVRIAADQKLLAIKLASIMEQDAHLRIIRTIPSDAISGLLFMLKVFHSEFELKCTFEQISNLIQDGSVIG